MIWVKIQEGFMKKDFLYIVSCETNNKKLFKIGVTKELDSRIKNLKTANPFDLQLEYYDEIEDAYKIEKILHKFFSKNKLEGEWFFDLELKEIRKRIEIIKLNYL